MARKTLKFRLYPNRSQRERLTATLDVCRELYNAGLQERIEAWKCRTRFEYLTKSTSCPISKQFDQTWLFLVPGRGNWAAALQNARL